MDWPVFLLISLQPACGVRTGNATRYPGFAVDVMVSSNSLGHLPNTFRIWRPSSGACVTFRRLHYVRDFGNRTQSISVFVLANCCAYSFCAIGSVLGIVGVICRGICTEHKRFSRKFNIVCAGIVASSVVGRPKNQ